MIAACLDVEAQRTTIEAYLHNNFEESSRPMLYTFTPPMQEEHAERITKIIAAHQISAAILSTPPEHRMFYMQLFLALGIHVLADKPLTAPYGVSVDPAASEQILKDYESVRDAYKAALAKTPGLVFDVMVQRRYHPVFQFAISKLKEVASITGCGLTHFQSTHADGQWRLPHEMIDIAYHGSNHGQGKACHSGYHFLDVAVLFAKESLSAAGKSFDSVEVSSLSVFPHDYSAIMWNTDYRKVFGESYSNVELDMQEFENKVKNHGEIDTLVSLAFKKDGKNLVIGNLNLLHNSFSGRYWLDAVKEENLYRENGRLRQEIHYLVQGPFQSIAIVSLRGCSKVPLKQRIQTDSSMEEPLEIHVFRNTGINRSWKAYEKVTLGDLIPDLENKDAHLRWARDNCITSFIDNCIRGGSTVSNLLSHEVSTKLLSLVCKSIATGKSVTDTVD